MTCSLQAPRVGKGRRGSVEALMLFLHRLSAPGWSVKWRLMCSSTELRLQLLLLLLNLKLLPMQLLLQLLNLVLLRWLTASLSALRLAQVTSA